MALSSAMDHTPHGSRLSSAVVAELGRRLTLLERQVKTLRAFCVLMDNFEREDVERLEALRRETPDLWRAPEKARLESNRQRQRLNDDLRARSMKPVPLLLSLDARIEKTATDWQLED
jgi:hypothetical protein